ncbi:RNA polymerase I enhancer binding protein [Sporothrix bragantina]|uniref:RNA polymerase I enhancer binding protein n=1 Tax=Sporothrix bragantina TaxID=671064 RepID=A0ABP0C122_9PEZI
MAPMAKASRLKMPPLSDSDSSSDSSSDSESDSGSASNVKTEPDEALKALANSGGLLSHDNASESSSNDDATKDSGDDEEDDDDDDDGYQPPQRQVFLSSVINPSSTPNVKAGAPSNSGPSPFDDTSDDDDDDAASSSDEDSSSSGSDSKSDGDDQNASEQESTTKKSTSKARASAKAAAPTGEASASDAGSVNDPSDSDDASTSSSSSDSDSNSDSNEEDNEASVAQEEPLASGVEPDATAKSSEEEIESSDDEMEDIPFSLPPGTNPDVADEAINGETEASDAAQDEEAPVKETQLKQTNDEQPEAMPEVPVETSELEPEPQTTPATTCATRQRTRRQVAKKSFVAGQEKAPEPASVTNDTEAANAEAMVNGAPAYAEPEVPSSAKSPRKRKRATIEAPESDHDKEPQTPAPRSAKKRATIRTPVSRSSAAASAGGGSSSKKGPQGNFTSGELETLQAAAAKYMEENHVAQADFNTLVHENAQKHTAMWDQIVSEFPDKKRLQVILRCRRIFHNFKQLYHWTVEQDAELAELVAKHGNKWQEIAGAMDRSSEDVRKRWNERVVCGDNVLLSYWRFDEEKRLGQIVGQLLREIQTSRNQDIATLHPDAVRDIPWQIVSERMDHTRTARQCRTKWRVIQEAYHFDADGEFVGPPPPTELSNSQIKAEKSHERLLKLTGSTPAKSSPLRTSGTANKSAKTANSSPAKSRLPLLGITPEEDGLTVPETARPINERTRKQVRSMTTEDKYRLVKSIRDSNVGREDKIPWPRLVDVSYRKRYERAARELVWSRLKRSVPNYNRKSVRQICEYLIKEYDTNEKVGQGWDVDFDAGPEGGEAASDGNDSAPALPSTDSIMQAIAAAKGKRPSTTYKSNEFVAESDSNEDEADKNGEADAGEESSIEEAAEALTKPRARRAARATRANGKLNGDTEKHVSESEAEADARPSRSARSTRAASARAKGQAARKTRDQALIDPYLDIEGASNPSTSQEKTSQNDDIEDVEDDEEEGARRRSRAASVDLSMGEKLSSAAEAGAEEANSEQASEQSQELPMTLSLSPGLAQSQPTVRSRPLAVPKQRGGANGSETNPPSSAHRPALASRFQPSDSTGLTPLRPGDVPRNKKRSLSAAKWQLDTGDEEGRADDIEDVSDTEKGGFNLSSFSGLVKSAFSSRKRPRQDDRQ